MAQVTEKEPRKVPTKLEIREKAKSLIEAWRRSREESLNREVAELELLPIDASAIARQLGLKIMGTEEFHAPSTRGRLDVSNSVITVAEKFSITSQRYTVAHEIGHHVFDKGAVHHREVRSGHLRPAAESRADSFAAEVLMPENLVRALFDKCFGGVIDGTIWNDDLAFYLSRRCRESVNADRLMKMTPIERAKLIAAATAFGSEQFKPLYRVFDVSIEAMALRLIELGLVL